LPPACATALQAIAIAGAVPAPYRSGAGAADIIVVPLQDSYIDCISAPPPPPATPAPVPLNENIAPPRKIKDVHPVYPKPAQDAGVQGRVVLESLITTAGCIARAEVRKGVRTDLDLEAMKAVSGWQFTPTLLNGSPVEVIMTVTVQFSLQ
jgi:TonB family protein